MPCNFGLPHHAKDISKLGVQRRATKMIPSSRNRSEEERLSHLDLFSLERHLLHGKLMECFKILNDFTNVDPPKLFVMEDLTGTRSNRAKLKCRQFHANCTKFFFINAVVRDSNILSPLLYRVTRLYLLRIILTLPPPFHCSL